MGKLLFDRIGFAYPSHDPSNGIAARGLREVSLSVASGEKVAVLGRNGSGKSTLIKIANGVLRPEAGSVRLEGIDGEASQDAYSCDIGYVGQDPDNQLVASTVFEEVAFGPCNLGLPLGDVRMRAGHALDVCGLFDLSECKVSELSGGQRQRLAIAGVLAMNPRFVLFDEPCSMLDPSSRVDVLLAIDALADEGRGILHVTHYLEDVLQYDRAVVMHRGRVAWEGSPVDLLFDDGALELAQCHVSSWLVTLKGLVGCGCLGRNDLALSPRDCARRAFFADRSFIGETAHSACKSACMTASSSDSAATDGPFSRVGPLVLEGVSFSYSDESRSGGRARKRGARPPALHLAANNVGLSVAPGEIVLLAGETGSGKTTVSRIATGLLQPSSGTATVDGKPVQAGEVGYSFQRVEDQLFASTVLEDVMFGPLNRGFGQAEALTSAKGSLELLGLDPEVFGRLNPFALSGGQMRRVSIAGVLAMETPFVVFDEPTVGLDRAGVEGLFLVIRELASRGVGVLVVSHDIDLCVGLVDRVALISRGSLVWEGDPADFVGSADAFRLAGFPLPGDARFAEELESLRRGSDGVRRDTGFSDCAECTECAEFAGCAECTECAECPECPECPGASGGGPAL